jgi:dTDP-4-amino-4,6-dideoxygalactose transaminase/nucleoside-diphosphate-sugar epimerase
VRRAPVVLVGGAGFVGTAAAHVLARAGRDVVVVDSRAPVGVSGEVRWVELDLLQDEVVLPEGEVVVLVGNGSPRPRWPWTLALHGPVATARLLPALAGRSVTLISSVEVYGNAPGELNEGTPPALPADDGMLGAWNADALLLARQPCPPWRVAAACRRLVELDPSGRWVYALTKRAQELLLAEHDGMDSLTVLRLANTFGPGQERVVSRLARRARCGRPMEITEGVVRSLLPVEEVGRALLFRPPPGTYNLGCPPVSLMWLAELLRDFLASSSPILQRPPPLEDSSGRVVCAALDRTGFRLRPLEDGLQAFVDRLINEQVPLFSPPVEVLVPPRSERPDEVADRQQEVLWRGRVRHGLRWSATLADELRSHLELSGEQELLLTTSGTEALRLAIAGTVGPACAGDVALAPSFTFPATAEVLVQLGYSIRFVDVDEPHWTLDPAEVEAALAEEPAARLVLTVDTFGNPCDYASLNAACDRFGAVLVADSAAALGSRRGGRPLATQAAAHAYSMSFAKVVSAAGAGGAVAFREAPRLSVEAGWTRSAFMDELHAIAALDQLRTIEELVARREVVAGIYEEAVADAPGLVAQEVDPADRHSRVHWVMRVLGPGRSDAMRAELDALGVRTKDYFRALHLGSHAAPVRLPVTDLLQDEVMALPMSSELVMEDAEAVAAALYEAQLRCAPLHEEVLA